MNQAALEEYFEDDDGAVLYYDEETDRVGIEPVEDSDADEAAYTVWKADSGGTIAGQSFLERYELLPDVTTQYDLEWDDRESLVTIDVDSPKKTCGSADETEAE